MGQGKPEQFNIYRFHSFESVVCFTDILLLCGGCGWGDDEVTETQPWCFVTCAVAGAAGMQGWACLQKEK